MIPAPLKEGDFVKAFALSVVGSIIGGALAGGIIGAVFGAVCSAIGASVAVVQRWAPILGGGAGLVVSYFVFRAVVLHFIARKLITVQATDGAGAV